MEFHGPRTQKLIEDNATDETAVLYTVPSGKKFWLISAMLSTDGGAVGYATIEIRNDSDVRQIRTNKVDVESAIGLETADHFEPGWPVELLEGWDIAIISSAASLVASGDIFGYETNE